MKFVCWLWMCLSLVLGISTTAQQPESPLLESYETYRGLRESTPYGLEWISLGPVVNSARVESVQLDPANPGTIYVAFGSGGLWKTINNGVTWSPIFENQPTHGIGDIALAPSDPNVIYVGTGESLKKARNFTIPGTGMYRSDNGGMNWKHIGLNDSWHISEVAVHPTNPDIVVVAVMGHFWSTNENRGLFQTTDGGKTWHHALKVDAQTGGNDVVWSTSDPNVVYASTWENYPGVAGENSSVYRSADSGRTWQKCHEGLPAGDGVGRIGLAVSHSDPQKVYALIDDRGQSNQRTASVYRSENGGEIWKKTHDQNLRIFEGIGWYFADLYVNPKNDEEIFALGIRVAKSQNGGKSFELLGGDVQHAISTEAKGLHVDNCELWINPINPNHLVLANDGGLYQSFDKGESWFHFNNLPTGEFYDIEIEQRAPYRIFGGTQDNSTVYGQAKELGHGPRWRYLWIDPWNGGDGCITRVAPDDSNVVYFSAQKGYFKRKNMDEAFSTYIKPRIKVEKKPIDYNFIAPMIISPHDSKTLLLGGNRILKSTDRGDSWKSISPDLSVSSTEREAAVGASAIAESPTVPGLICAGTDNGAFWITEDNGENWKEPSTELPIAYIRSIVPSKYSDSRIYVAASGLNFDEFDTHLYCSEDLGASWTSIASNLPSGPANVIIEDPFQEHILYAGLFHGVYVSLDRGQTWQLLGKNLPVCSVSDLGILLDTNELIVATHGRGIFKADLTPFYQTEKLGLANEKKDYLFPIPDVVKPDFGDLITVAKKNDYAKVTISYWLNQSCKATLKILDKDDKVLRRFDVSGDVGLNQFRWDCSIELRPKSTFGYQMPQTVFLSQDKYKVRLETDHGTSEMREVIVRNEKPESQK